MTNRLAKSLTYVSTIRKEVEEWFKFHGLVLSGAEWFQPYSNTKGTLTFENNAFMGTIFEERGPN